jgi:very-short-patch-repair endonuclease
MGYYCSKCKKTIPYAVYSYSMENHGKALCREHQKSPSGIIRNVIKTVFSDLEPKRRPYPKQRTFPTKKETKKTEPTPEAKSLYYALKKRGIRSELEKWDGFKHIDIAITSAKLNIEVDGKQHHSHRQSLADLKRTFHSSKKGYETIRIPNTLVRKDVKEAAEYIAELVRTRRNLE